MYSGGILCYYRSIALSLVALSLVALSSGIAVFALLRNRSSSSKPEDEGSKNLRPFVDEVDSDGEKEDIISQLPDEILIQVIDRLTARDAVRTSVLSKRWTYIYSFVHDVNFNCLHMFGLPDRPCHLKGFCDLKDKFSDGVDSFFHRHCSYTKMRSIKFSCCFISDFPHKLNAWIHSAGRLGVEKLILSFRCSTEWFNFFFQLHLLSEVPSLEHLELHTCYLYVNLEIQCYSLKTLHLHEVSMGPSDIECIVSNCLSLQTWAIHRCRFLCDPKLLSIHGPNLQLEVLSVFDCELQEIELYASNLITFEWSHHKMIKFSFDHVPKLQNFSANLCDEEEDVMPFLYSKLAKNLPQLSSLIFQTNGKCYQEICSPSGAAMFRNLRQLVLTFYDVFESDLFSLSRVLDMCPVLQEFHLVTKMTEFSGEQVNSWNALSKSQLKKVEWSGFCGTDNEISFAKYILKSVGTLEQMYINLNFQYYCGFGRWGVHGACKWSDDRREMMCEWLQRQAISKNARVIFRPAK